MRPARPNRRYGIALFLDRHLGPPACALLLLAKRFRRAARDAEPGAPIRRVLVVKFWGMGSIILATPLLTELRARYPEARIDFATLRENEAILRLCPDVERRILLDLGRGISRFLLDSARVLFGIRRERYDLVLDLEFFTRYTAIFSALSRARRTHGFSAKGSWRGRLHDVEVPFNTYHHVAVNFLMLLRGEPLEPVGAVRANEDRLLPLLVPPPAARARCQEIVEQDPAFRHGRPLVVVNPNAGDMALERRWPAEGTAQVLAALVARDVANVALTGSASERAYVESVAALSGVSDRIINLAGRIGIEELVALLARAAVVVTNDSGPLHIACAAGASTVALFGPETPVLYGPLRARPGQRHHVHYRGLGCSPCMFVHDNKVLSCWFAQARCMTGIEPQEILGSVMASLGSSEGRSDVATRLSVVP